MTPLIFHAGGAAVWMIVTLTLLTAGGLAVLEWRRAERRRLGWRLGATLLAVGALALLALRPAWRGRAPDGTGVEEAAATLWTAGASGGDEARGVDGGGRRFALPDAAVPASAGATVLPDVAALRRRFPEIGRLRIVGDGLEAFDLAPLTGVRVDFQQPEPRASAAGGAAVVFLRCPRVISPGEPLTVEGRIGGLPAGGTVVLVLESPDGTTTENVTPAADERGEAGFSVSSAPPPAAGRFVWRLRLRTPGENGRVLADEPLGVAVAAPALPRVLVLESAPRFDTTLLRRWYERAGGTLRARVRLGQDRHRFFSAGGGTPAEWNALDAGLLAGFDLVLADARALASLPAAERETLRAAVADTGLGVLTLADDALLPPAVVAPDRAWLFPWLLRPWGNGGDDDGTGPAIPADAVVTAANNGVETLARVRWTGAEKPVETPLPVAPFEIAARPGQTGVVRDGQGRTLAAVAMLGRGRLALTLVRETGRWQRGGDAGAFAGYWAAVLTQVARPRGEVPWTLAGGDGGPVFVDQPVECVRTGPAEGPPPVGVSVADGSGEGAAAFAPTGEPGAPGRWRVTYWPRRAGWHRLEEKNGGGGGGLDFYVSPAGTWPGLAAARRRGATARFAARAVGEAAGKGTTPRGTEEKPVPAGWWWGAFMLGAGFLWTERRRAEDGRRRAEGGGRKAERGS